MSAPLPYYLLRPAIIRSAPPPLPTWHGTLRRLLWLGLALLAVCGPAAASPSITVPIFLRGESLNTDTSQGIGANGEQLTDNSGLSFPLDQNAPVDLAESVTHTISPSGHQLSWVTSNGGNMRSDYFVSNPPPVFVWDLGSDKVISKALLWVEGNDGGAPNQRGNQARVIEFRFHIDAQGAEDFADAESVSVTLTLDTTTTGQTLPQSAAFGGKVARYVQMTFVDNFYGQPGVVAGGDRVGLGELRFVTEEIPQNPASPPLQLIGWGGGPPTSCPDATLGDIRQISAQGYHTVALKNDGTVIAWGANDRGQSSVPVGLRNVKAVAAGTAHTVALKEDGTVVNWGGIDSNQTAVPPGLNNVKAVAAGYSHTLALKTDGTVVAWGLTGSVPPGLSGVIAIAAGYNNSVALKSDGTVVAWGDNSYGKSTVPAGLRGVKAIAAGQTNTLALKEDGTVVGWGSNFYDLNSDATQLSGIIEIAAGFSHCMARRNDGNVVVWGGSDLYGGGGIGIWRVGDAVGIAMGDQHLCILKSNGQILLRGRSDDQGQSRILSGIRNVKALAAGNSHTVALKNDGTVFAWGDNFRGQVNVPPGLSEVAAITAGPGYTVALRNDGKVVGWGFNDHGELRIPEGLSGVSAIVAKGRHTLALKSNGTVAAWGWNEYGQCTVPAGLSGVTAVAVGFEHSLALKSDGTIVAWGSNGYGQRTVPPGLSGVTKIAAAYRSSVALKHDGTVVVWGDWSASLLAAPAGLSGVVDIAAGDYHIIALRNNGTVTVWGLNEYGSCEVPAGLTGVVGIAANSHACLVLVDPTPFLSGAEAVSVTRGQPLSYQITASHEPTSYHVEGTLPSGVSVNATTGLIHGTPDEAGVFAVTLQATNASATGTKALTITALPVLEDQEVTATLGEPLPAATTLTSSESGAGVTYTSTGLPAGIMLDPATGALTGTPTAEGVTSVPISVSKAGATASAVLTVTVNAPAPVLSSGTEAVIGMRGQPLSYQIMASNDPTSYGVSGPLPAGVSVNATSGLIQGTLQEAGVFVVTLQATNAGGTGTKPLTITSVPVLENQTVTATVGQPLSATLASSENGAGVTYTATGLPGGITLDPVTGVLTGTPTAEGETFVPISVSKGGATASAVLTVTVSVSATPLQLWRIEHFGSPDATGTAADDADPDGDGFTNLEEYAAGTDPHHAGSFFRVLSFAKTGDSLTLTVPGLPGRRYELQRLLATPGATWTTVATQQGPLEAAGPVELLDPAAPAGTALYRIQVSLVP